MQLNIRQTEYQKRFLSFVKDQSIQFYKEKFSLFNLSGELDHSLTTAIFNLINKEISSITELSQSLTESYDKFKANSKNLKKGLLDEHSLGGITVFFTNYPKIDHKIFTSTLKESSEEYRFLYTKFSIIMDRLIIYMGVYEELYLVNTLTLSYNASFSLHFENSVFSFGTRTNKVEFKVIPIFFLVKLLHPKLESESIRTSILEELLNFDFQSVPFLLTISDMDQITSFYDICNMKYLHDFYMEKLFKGLEFQLPRIINLSQLHI